MRCIVAAVDGSDNAQRAVDLAADLASKFGADLVLAYVITAAPIATTSAGVRHPATDLRVPPRVQTVAVSDVPTDAAEDALAQAKARAEAKGARRVETETRAGEPAEMILSVAKERGADAIVLGKRGRGRLAGLLLGSISQKVVAQAECAVIVLP